MPVFTPQSLYKGKVGNVFYALQIFVGFSKVGSKVLTMACLLYEHTDRQ